MVSPRFIICFLVILHLQNGITNANDGFDEDQDINDEDINLSVSGEHPHKPNKHVIGGSFGYWKTNATIRWSETSPQCNGTYQSPISLAKRRATERRLPALELVGYRNPPLTANLTNDGHSAKMLMSWGERRPKVFGAHLDGEYQLENMHFHWGKKNSRGSEHTLNSIRFPMEVHLVHSKTQYGSIENALQHPDGLVVLAFFFQLREADNTRFKEILKILPHIHMPGGCSKVRRPPPLSELLPCHLDNFFTYTGSLTTPPCSESVTWFVFTDVIPLSFKQIGRFRRLRSRNHRLVDNYRKLQPIGNREIIWRKQ